MGGRRVDLLVGIRNCFIVCSWWQYCMGCLSLPVSEAVAISILVILATISLVLLIRSQIVVRDVSKQKPNGPTQKRQRSESSVNIADRLSDLGMRGYAGRFIAHGIDAAMLSRLTSVDLQELRIPIQDRLRILAAEDEIKRRSEARHDFVRRFVAVAVSVGFAAALARMIWVSEGTAPNLIEGEQLGRLGTAFFVILLGWEWHHKDLGIYKTTSLYRFIVDVAVVITSLFFLISYANQRIWLISLAAIFAWYVVWDFVNFVEDPNFRSRPSPFRGPATNALWLGYFVVIGVLTIFLTPTFLHTMCLCIAILAGVFCLTLQGNYPENWDLTRRLLAVFLLLLLFVVFSFGVFPQTLLANELQVYTAEVENGRVVVSGRVRLANVAVRVGSKLIQSDADGSFHETIEIPTECIVRVRYGAEVFEKTIVHCDAKGNAGPAGPVGPKGDIGPRIIGASSSA
jgi:hypothetical protein